MIKYTGITGTAVIMAAGAGVRFGEHTHTKPKGFVSVGGKPMIIRSIDNLLAAGIERIIIGVGYHAEHYEELAKQYPQITCCRSDRYNTTNSMYTLMCCSRLAGDDDFLLLESDLIYQRSALPALMNCGHPSAILTTPPTKLQDGYYVDVDADGYLTDCTTDIAKRELYRSEFVGIHRISAHLCRRMCDWYASVWHERPMLGYEYALLEMARCGERIYVHREERLRWYEIDDEADLLHAEQHVAPYL